MGDKVCRLKVNNQDETVNISSLTPASEQISRLIILKEVWNKWVSNNWVTIPPVIATFEGLFDLGKTVRVHLECKINSNQLDGIVFLIGCFVTYLFCILRIKLRYFLIVTVKTNDEGKFENSLPCLLNNVYVST